MTDHIRATNRQPTQTSTIPTLDPIVSVERRVTESTEIWARDLRSLFEHAKERFGDVTWESEEGGERIWAHKAVIYARAPKTFKERYFPPRSFSRSPHSFTSPSPSPTPYLPSHLLNGHGHGNGNGNGRAYSPGHNSLHAPRAGTESSLSVGSINSENTIRGQGDAVLRLTHGDTPELFSAQLEWLYTGEGFGDVVEWIEEDNDTGGSIRDSLGRRGDIHDRRDKLGQDLTYMWRSKLYVDVRIHLTPQTSLDSDRDDDSDSSTDSLSSTAVFTSHRFILCSRSPYFASVLLNPSFKPQSTADIHLPTPPFTPAALHFCLGYMYAGHLDFSNRTFDLSTAFAIYRAAMYLQLEALVQEIESRIVHDYCHGLEVSKCKCRRCPLRAARVWRFATEPDIGAIQLRNQARRYVVEAWGQSWGREVGLASQDEKDSLVKDVCGRIRPDSIISTWRNIQAVRTRMENGSMAKGREANAWVEPLSDMVEQVESRAREVLISHFAAFAESAELWALVSGKGFDGEILDTIAQETVDAVGTVKGCLEGPKVYQALVSSLLLKVDPDTLGPALPPRSRSRQQIEQAREGILAHIRRRWMQIRDAGGFQTLENWSLKEISDEIEVSVDDLLGPSALSSLVRTRLGAPPGIPRTTSRVMSLSDAASVRSTASSSTQLSSVSRPSTLRAGPPVPVEAPGLRRLRLSSSASTSSVTSARSTARSVSGPATAPFPGSASARSPTAARQGPRVSIRARNNASPTPSTRPARQMSGPIRPLLTRPNPPAASADTASTSSALTASTTPSAIPRATTSPKSPSKSPAGAASQAATRKSAARVSNAAAGPSRTKTPTPSIAPSVRRAPRPKSPAPSTATLRSRAGPSRPKSPTPSTAPSVRKVQAQSRPKSPVPSTTSVRSRLPSTTSAVSKPAPSTVAGIRNRQPSSTSQASTLARPAAAAAPPKPVPTGRPTVGSTVRSRAAAINAQNSAAAAKLDPKTTTTKKATAVEAAEPSKSTAGTSARLRSPSVSSVASAASRRSTGTRVTTRLAVPTEPVPVRNRAVSSTVAGTSKAQTPSARRKTSTSTLPDHIALDTSKSTLAIKSPLVPVGAKPRSSATRPFPVSGKGIGSGSALLLAPRNPPSSVPLTTEGLRSPSGSTNETAEAITPRLDTIALEPVIRREGSDVSDPHFNSDSTIKEQSLPPPIANRISDRPYATRKTSQTSTRSTASSFRPHPASAFDPPRREVQPAILSVLQIPDGDEPFLGPGVALRQGIGCIVSLEKKRARFRAMIKYIGLLKDSTGPWIGIETDDLDRFGVKTLDTGSKDGTHYFHLSTPPFVPDSNRTARQRKLDLIRQSLGKRASVFIGSTTNSGLGIPKFNHQGTGHKRSISPFAGEQAAGHFERPRALFIRPHEVVFVLGAE